MKSAEKRETACLRKIILLLMLLTIFALSSLSVLAETQRDVTMYSGDSVSFEGYNVHLLAGSSFGNMMVKIDGIPKIIDFVDEQLAADAGVSVSGKITVSEREDIRSRMQSEDMVLYLGNPVMAREGDLKVELKRICMSVAKDNCGRYNPKSMEVEPSYLISLRFSEPGVSVKTKYDKTSVLPGEQVMVTTTIENNGDVTVSDFLYEENFPESVVLKLPDTLSRTERGFKYSLGLLKPEETKTFSYKIHLRQPLEYSLKGSYSYSYRNQTYSDFTSNSAVTLVDILSATLAVPDDAEIKTTDKITVKVKNLIDKKVDAGFSIVIPGDLSIKKVEGCKLVNGTYFLQGVIAPKATSECIITIDFDKLGEYHISGRLFGKVSGSDFDMVPEYLSETLSVVDEFDDFLVLSKFKFKNVLENDSVPIEVHVLRSENVGLEDIFINVSSSHAQISPKSIARLSKMDKSTDEKYHNFYFHALVPLVSSKTPIPVKVFARAKVIPKNSPAYYKNFSSTTLISDYDVSDAVSFDRMIVPNRIKQNETCIVTVFAKNNLDNRYFGNAYAKDYPPAKFLFKPIMSESNFDLLPNEKKTLYSYQLKAPYFVDPTVSEVATFYDISIFNTTFYDDLSTVVDLIEPGISSTFSFEQDDFFVGDEARIRMNVINDGDLDCNDIVSDYPLFKNMDFIIPKAAGDLAYGSSNFFKQNSVPVQYLQPGEKVTFFANYLMKTAGEEESSSIIKYHDTYGNIFNDTSDDVSVEIENGQSPCFLQVTKRLNVTLINNSFKGNLLPFMIDTRNYCDKEASISFNDPSISFKVSPHGNKSVSYSRKVFSSASLGSAASNATPKSGIMNFTGEAGSIYVYTYGEDYLMSKTNSVMKQFKLITPEKPTKTTPPRKNETEIRTVVPEDIGPGISILKRFLGLAAVIIVVLLFMGASLKILSVLKARQKKKKETIEKMQMEDMLIPPGVGEGIDSLDNFIIKAKQNAVPEIEIEQSLLLKGWSKDVVDAFMKKKE